MQLGSVPIERRIDPLEFVPPPAQDAAGDMEVEGESTTPPLHVQPPPPPVHVRPTPPPPVHVWPTVPPPIHVQPTVPSPTQTQTYDAPPPVQSTTPPQQVQESHRRYLLPDGYT